MIARIRNVIWGQEWTLASSLQRGMDQILPDFSCHFSLQRGMDWIQPDFSCNFINHLPTALVPHGFCPGMCLASLFGWPFLFHLLKASWTQLEWPSWKSSQQSLSLPTDTWKDSGRKMMANEVLPIEFSVNPTATPSASWHHFQFFPVVTQHTTMILACLQCPPNVPDSLAILESTQYCTASSQFVLVSSYSSKPIFPIFIVKELSHIIFIHRFMGGGS